MLHIILLVKDVATGSFNEALACTLGELPTNTYRWARRDRGLGPQCPLARLLLLD
jgi:hypothetical protein